ncbi:MAG TPA: PAS domain S-box protein [Longimicrobiales bacterium]
MNRGIDPPDAENGLDIDAAPVGAVAPIGAVASEAPDWIAPACALITGALAVAVLFGWQLGLTQLTHASPGGIAMPPLVAAGLLMGALALWLLQPAQTDPTRRGFGDVLAGLVVALGAAALLEHAARIDLGIDLLLFGRAIAGEGTRYAGRPSLTAAIHFTLLGAALLLLGDRGRRVRIAQWLALASLLVAGSAALGFLYRIPALYRANGVPASLSAALLALVLSLGVLFARRRVGLMGAITGSDVGGLAARRLMPIGVLLPVLLGALIAEGVRAGAIEPAFGFFLVGALLSIAFAAVVLRSALVLRGIDRERRQAARSLVQSEERFRSLAENASDAMITIDARGRVVFANPAAVRLFGYEADELQHMHLSDLMPARFRDVHREAVRRYERTGRRRLDWGGTQLAGLRRDGREVPLEITLGEYVHDGARYYTGIMRDITERMHGERSQRLLVEAGRVLSASLDPQATLRGVARLTVAEMADWCVVYGGGDAPEVIELASRDLVREIRLREMERRYPPAKDGPVCRALRTGEPVLMSTVDAAERRTLAYGGAEHYELLCEVGCDSLLVVPLVTRGRTIGALALGQNERGPRYEERDVATARELAVRIAFAVDNARLYEAARAARAQAEARAQEIERITESRARLVRGFSHDLKNPLGAAQGHADLLESGVLGALQPRQRDSLGRIRTTIDDALGLIDELVELARAESGQLELRNDAVEAGMIAHEVVEEHMPRAEAKGLRLAIDNRPAPAALADAARVRQIIANLVTNAIKYTHEGSVTVRVGTERRAAAELQAVTVAGRREGDDVLTPPRPSAAASAHAPWVRIDVEDTGPGVTPEQQARMFDEFSRFSDEEPGAGLGLAISRNLAEAMGGTISVRSRPGEGSCFTLWLRTSPSAASNDDGRRVAADGASPPTDRVRPIG